MTEPKGYITKAKSVHWGTPTHILERFEGYFDPCPHPLPDFNGLDIPWPNKVFINPPFKALKPWVKKIAEEHKGKEERGDRHHFVLLMPARVDTKYFHEHVLPHAGVEFIKGRLKFVDLDNSSAEPVNAPFATIIAHYRNNIRWN